MTADAIGDAKKAHLACLAAHGRLKEQVTAGVLVVAPKDVVALRRARAHAGAQRDIELNEQLLQIAHDLLDAKVGQIAKGGRQARQQLHERGHEHPVRALRLALP